MNTQLYNEIMELFAYTVVDEDSLIDLHMYAVTASELVERASTQQHAD